MSEAADMNYYRLRAAQHRFGVAPDQLDSEQQQWLEGAVARQHLLETKLLALPEAAQVVVGEEAVQRALESLREQYEDEEDLLDDLCALGLNATRVEALLERQLRVELVIERCTPASEQASEEEAYTLYENFPEKFHRPERRRVQHLLITLNDDYEENQRGLVVARMSKIRQRVMAQPAEFEEQISRYSECPSVLQGGDLGWIPAGHLYPQIDAVLFGTGGGLGEGNLSDVIETEVGMHLIRCNGIEPAGVVPFAKVEARIRQRLDEQSSERARRRWLASLMA
ncbi:nitrogen fixation protein NifM [Aestuariirhabdus sp. LZHN29]|uniref:nitrogen fixation protein NifM n=1 Tax=Aestuariirhabdus sp. LZHN29 TaxID=3417462 RepID=UPI003CECE389